MKLVKIRKMRGLPMEQINNVAKAFPTTVAPQNTKKRVRFDEEGSNKVGKFEEEEVEAKPQDQVNESRETTNFYHSQAEAKEEDDKDYTPSPDEMKVDSDYNPSTTAMQREAEKLNEPDTTYESIALNKYLNNPHSEYDNFKGHKLKDKSNSTRNDESTQLEATITNKPKATVKKTTDSEVTSKPILSDSTLSNQSGQQVEYELEPPLRRKRVHKHQLTEDQKMDLYLELFKRLQCQISATELISLLEGFRKLIQGELKATLMPTEGPRNIKSVQAHNSEALMNEILDGIINAQEKNE